ncbi:MAG TPA: D-glycero-alpha-D-manno-heptose-1,7-bisphosphate 7-phosphatase [Candidatus Brocadiia bacterium]|nr:HAD family hydrolase [Candidatus Brocadiales bacterium]
MKKAIFLDRDGVINKVFLSNGKPFSPRRFSEFELIPEVENALNSFKEVGFTNIVITNQPDIARGFLKWEELEKMHSLIRERLSIGDIFVCPHSDKDNCLCRKPKPGALLEAAKKWNVDLKGSFFIGDTWKDTVAGKRAGCKTILINMPYNQGVESDYRIEDLNKAVEIIMDSKQ